MLNHPFPSTEQNYLRIFPYNTQIYNVQCPWELRLRTSQTTGEHLYNVILLMCAAEKKPALGQDMLLAKGDVVYSLKT